VADLLVPTRPVLTVRQPHADLSIAGVKSPENRTWPVPSTLPCADCGFVPADAKRTWRDVVGACTPFPFRLWIHAAKQVDRDAPDDAWMALYDGAPTIRENVDAIIADLALLDAEATPVDVLKTHVSLGALVGSVLVTGCHHADDCATWDRGYCSLWAMPDQWHWELAGPEPLDEPIPIKGRLGLWRLPDDAEVPA
jgi:hypothetical protein